jgi:hypothetical protein
MSNSAYVPTRKVLRNGADASVARPIGREAVLDCPDSRLVKYICTVNFQPATCVWLPFAV